MFFQRYKVFKATFKSLTFFIIFGRFHSLLFMKNFSGILFLLILLVSCKKDYEIERSFYYWQNNSGYNIDFEKVEELGTKKIYFKFFEVDYSETMGNFPFSKNKPYFWREKAEDSLTIVPVVFIKNEIFQYNNEKDLDKLADNIVYLIEKYHKEAVTDRTELVFDEIQIDCDWTKSTKEKYFYLLKIIKTKSNKTISCTLRLYPYAYPDIMGIPPVDKATLMCYNLIKPLTEKNKNSILDVDELEKYLKNKKKYPLHTDIALPIFGWTQLYKNNRFAGLIDIDEKSIASFARQTEPMWYEINKDTVINYDSYFRKGDQVKCETITIDELNKSVDLLKRYLNIEGKTTVTLFDLDSKTFKIRTNEELEALYNRFLQ